MNYIEQIEKEIELLEKDKNACKQPYEFSDKLTTKVKEVLKDLDNNHNHSWAIEIFNKNKKNLNKVAIQYRGNNITYESMFNQAYMYAKSLKYLGIGKGDEIPICTTNIPEFIYLFLAASFIGAKINVVGDWFNHEYLTEIINNSSSKYMFVDDLAYETIKESINNSNAKNIIMFSLTDSFKRNKNNEAYNPYEEIDSKFHKIENKVNKYKQNNSNILSTNEFINLGRDYNDNLFEQVDLNDPLTITYTSGTTSPGRPKGVIQSNRSYITLARFYEPDVSGTAEMKDLKFLGHIPPDTHIALSCGISDTLYCGCTYDCEPFYSKEFFPYALLINKSNFVTTSTGYWAHLCKLLNYDDSWKNVKLPFLMIPTVTGEACSEGEEKFFNYTSRKHKFGVDKLPYPLSPVTFSIGGGTTEGTGIFVTLFKSLLEKLPNNFVKGEGLGLTPIKFAEIEVLNKNLDYCKLHEPGVLVEKSPCEMIGYTDDKYNAKTRITDKYGKEWLNLGIYSYKSDRQGRVKMKGRANDDMILSDGSRLPIFYIEDEILRDTKNIMSCTIVNVNSTRNSYVCHIEFQPTTKKSSEYILKSMCKRLKTSIPEEALDNLFIRVRDFKESYPLDPSGKRSTSLLKSEGINEKCIEFNIIDQVYNNTKNKVLVKK